MADIVEFQDVNTQKPKELFRPVLPKIDESNLPIAPSTTEVKSLEELVAELDFPAQNAYQSITLSLRAAPELQEKIYDFIAKQEEEHRMPRRTPGRADDFLDPNETPRHILHERLNKTVSGRRAQMAQRSRQDDMSPDQESKMATNLKNTYLDFLKRNAPDNYKNKVIQEELVRTGEGWIRSILDRMKLLR